LSGRTRVKQQNLNNEDAKISQIEVLLGEEVKYLIKAIN